MARERRQTRHERRFGKAERLVDQILGTPAEQWRFHPSIDRKLMLENIRHLQIEIASCAVIIADNVNDYWWTHPQEEWFFKKDFPCCAPPFSKFFIEHSAAQVRVLGKTVERLEWNSVERIGMLIEYIDAEGKKFLRPAGPQAFDQIDIPEAKWFVRALYLMRDHGEMIHTSTMKYFAVNGCGQIIEDPCTFCGMPVDELSMRAMSESAGQTLITAMLAVCFMHCKNVEKIEHSPDHTINRERRKAGLKPFVRYHTINIEPMKKVLKADGNSETEGLKRALHICRGHFSTYSEEKPLFGRIAGTFWVPSHVRGSIKKGVVVSDYNVKP